MLRRFRGDALRMVLDDNSKYLAGTLRCVWDGDQTLYEIRAPGTEAVRSNGGDGVTTTGSNPTVEQDWDPTNGLTLAVDPYGLARYTRSGRGLTAAILA